MITFLNDSMCGGGAEKSMARIVNELSKDRELNVISLENNFCVDLRETIKTAYFNEHLTTKASKLISLVKDSFQLKKFVRLNSTKVVVSFQYRSNFINSISKLLGSKHKVIVCERNYPEKALEYLPIFKYLLKILYKKADVVVVNALDTKELLQEWHIDNVVHISNGYNKKEIKKCSNEEVESQYQHLFKKKSIINVGRLTYQKGQCYLIDALVELPDYHLLLIGIGEDKDKLQAHAKKVGVEQRLFFLGYQENPYKFIKLATVFVFPSLYEGFPNALAEAVILQKPVVSFDFKSGARDILGDKLVTIGDVNSLVQNIKQEMIYEDTIVDIQEIAEKYLEVIDNA